MKTSEPAMTSASVPLATVLCLSAAAISVFEKSIWPRRPGRSRPTGRRARFARAEREQEFGDGDSRRSRAVDRDPNLAHRAAAEFDRVEQRRRDDDRGAVLIVMEDRHVEQFAQACARSRNSAGR